MGIFAERRRKTSKLGGLRPRGFEELRKRRGKQFLPPPKEPGIFMQALDIISRPLFGVAGGVKAVIKRENIFEEIGKGLSGEEKETFSDILDELGVRNKPLKFVGGFALDVLLDPLTYIGIGALTKAGRVARGAGRLAPTVAAQAAKQQRGLLTFAGRRVLPQAISEPGLRGLARGGTFLRETAPGISPAIQAVGKALSTKFRPKNVSPSQWKKLMAAKQLARNVQKVGTEEAFKFSVESGKEIRKLLKKKLISDDEVKTLLTGLERKSRVGLIAEPLRPLYKDLDRYAKSIRKRRKLLGKEVITEQDYNFWIHTLSQEARDEIGNSGVNMFRLYTSESASDIARHYLKFGDDVINTKTGDIFRKGKVIDFMKPSLVRQGKKAGKFTQATIDEVNTAVGRNLFEADIATTAFEMGKRISRQEAGTEFFNMAKAIGRPVGKAPAGWMTTKVDELAGLRFHPEIAKHIDETVRAITSDEMIGKVIRGYDKILNFWKGTATIINPAFHARNFVSNIWQNHIGGVSMGTIKGIRAYQKGMRTVFKEYAKDPGRRRLEGFFARLSGEKPARELFLESARTLSTKKGYLGKIAKGTPAEQRAFLKNLSERDVLKLFEANGLRRAGQFGTDIPRTIRQEMRRVSAFKAGRAVGNLVEDSGKFVHFVSKLQDGFTPAEAARSVRKFLFDYDELTNFERNVMKRIFPFYSWCVPDDSEALTREGWKMQHDVHIGDEILTYNIEKDLFEWQPVKEKGVFDYNGTLIHSRSSKVNFEFTPDHRWVVENQDGERKIVKGYQLRSNHRFILTADYKQEESLLTKKEAAILGWIVTDGYHRWRGNCIEAMIYQSPEKHADLVRKLLGDWCSSESVHPDNGVICFRIKTKKLEYIKSIFKSKNDLPYIVSNLNKDALEAYWDVCVQAEGHEDEKQVHFAQSHGPVLDSFQIATLLLGKACNLSSRGCYVKKSKRMKIHNTLGTNWYSGKVWCPVVGNGTWLMRRHGKPVVTGNTRKNIPLQLETLITQPGKFAQFPKAIMELERSAEGKAMPRELLPEWFQKTFPVFIGQKETPGGIASKFMKLEGFLPATDINKLFEAPQTELFSMVSPLIKAPFELTINRNTFFEQAIKDYPGQNKEFLNVYIPARLEYLLRQIRPLSDAHKFIGAKGRERELTENLLNVLSGFKIYEFNEREQREIAKWLNSKAISEYTRDVKAAKRRGALGEAQRIQRLLERKRR